MFFNYKYIHEHINEDSEHLLEQFRRNHSSDIDIAREEFVSVNSNVFQLLASVYDFSCALDIIGNKIVLYEKKEFESMIDDLKLSFEEQHMMDLLKKDKLILEEK